jgi:hypothetical protein
MRNPPVDIEGAKTAGQPIVQGLLTYKKEHGRYPVSLQEAGLANVVTSLGSFEYERRGEKGDEYFVLSVGDHARNGFVLFWNSEMTTEGWMTEE